MDLRNTALSDALRAVPKIDLGGWVWVYNTVSTTRQGAKTDTDATVLNAKLSPGWTGRYKALAGGPCTPADTPDGSSQGAKLIVLDPSSDMPGADARQRVSVQRCDPCANPHVHDDTPKYFPAEMTQCVPNDVSKRSLRYNVTQDDVSTPLQTLEVEKVTGRQQVRSRGEIIVVMYEMHWTDLSESSWGRESIALLCGH